MEWVREVHFCAPAGKVFVVDAFRFCISAEVQKRESLDEHLRELQKMDTDGEMDRKRDNDRKEVMEGMRNSEKLKERKRKGYRDGCSDDIFDIRADQYANGEKDKGIQGDGGGEEDGGGGKNGNVKGDTDNHGNENGYSNSGSKESYDKLSTQVYDTKKRQRRLKEGMEKIGNVAGIET
jgi:hypothetical protein